MMMIKKFRKMNDVQTPYGSIFPHLTRESFQRKKKIHNWNEQINSYPLMILFPFSPPDFRTPLALRCDCGKME